MFGILKPSFLHLPPESKALYHASYCNLCAALSASGLGAVNRFFLINDVVTIDWLLTEENQSTQHPFACNNCKKFGVIGKKSKVTDHQKFLAAASSFMVGVKLKDNAEDNPSFKTKMSVLAYFPIMRKAKKSLKALSLLDAVKHNLKLDQQYEASKTRELSKASLPTENCYEMLALEASKALSTLPHQTISLFGRYLGRYIYLHDAMKDMDTDLENKQYNVLNASVNYQGQVKQKEAAVKQLLHALQSMHHELFEQISSLPERLGIDALRMKWESLFLNIEQQLFGLIKPLNNSELFNIFSSFSVIGGGVGNLVKPMLNENPCSGCPICDSFDNGGCDFCSESCVLCNTPFGGGCIPCGDDE